MGFIVLTAVLSGANGIVSFLMPVAVLTAMFGVIARNTFRRVLARMVFRWIRGHGFVLAMTPHGTLIGWLNWNAARVNLPDGASRVLGWPGRPFPRLVVALPTGYLLPLLTRFVFRLVAPDLRPGGS